MKISASALAACLLLLCSGAMATRSKYITVGSAVGQADHYPQCGLPAPYQTTNLRRVFNPDGSLMSCVDLSSLPPSNNVQAFDLFALQLVVNPQCSKAVTSITFNGKAMTPVITAFAREQNVGVKIAGPSEYAPLVQYSALRTQRAQVCITLKTPCANADSLYNIITYFTQQFPVDATRCATTPLFNPAPAPAQTTTTSSPAPCGSSPSPAPCSSPSPVPCSTASPSPAPRSSPSPAPCSTASPSPAPCTTASPSPAPCNSPKPAPCSSPSMPTVPSGTAYPICTLPSPYLTSGRKLTFDAAGDLTTCVQLSALPPANNRQAFDLQALQMVVSLQGKCAGAVKSVTFDGQAMTPTITQYTREQNVGIKISGNNGSPLATYASLRVRPVTVCLTMKFPCASADNVYNTVTFFAPDNCATTPLFDPNQQAW